MSHLQAAGPPASSESLVAKLRHAGLRPTRQRVGLARVIFGKGHRHLSAEELHIEAEAAGFRVSLATVYNALNQFTDAGLLREVAVDSGRAFFDTNVSDHHHFFVEGEGRLIDLEGDIGIDKVPEPPPGMEVVSVELVVRVRRRS